MLHVISLIDLFFKFGIECKVLSDYNSFDKRRIIKECLWFKSKSLSIGVIHIRSFLA